MRLAYLGASIAGKVGKVKPYIKTSVFSRNGWYTLSIQVEYQKHSEGTLMADTSIPGGETTSTEEAYDIENFPVEGTTDTMELDLELEEELIIEDFTIDGICGVY